MAVARELKKETHRTIARLGQVNATVVGRFPHRTDLLEQVSDAYLDAMFILGGGDGPASVRLQSSGRIWNPGRTGGKALRTPGALGHFSGNRASATVIFSPSEIRRDD
jgi:hypothetical protein